MKFLCVVIIMKIPFGWINILYFYYYFNFEFYMSKYLKLKVMNKLRKEG